MTTGQLIILDHVIALVTAALWIAAGATTASGATKRPLVPLALLAGSILATAARVTMAAVLAGRGWWFAQEKLLLGLPMLLVAGLAALFLAGPPLLAARKNAGAQVPPVAITVLMTAGYAAAAGLLVTFLVGYPLAWSTVLLAVSLVAAAALLTWRVVAPQSTGQAEPGKDISRRRFLRLAGTTVVTGTAATGVGLLFVPGESVATGGGRGAVPRPAGTVSMTDLRGPRAPAPGGTVRRYELTAQKATVRLASGREVEAWTYGGKLPGTPLTATTGDLLEVTLRNTDIDDGVTLHWHGYNVPCGEDGAPGVTQDVVRPGEEFVYRFRADQLGTYWYHTHQASHRGVRRGLYGTLVVTPAGTTDDGLDLTVPLHTLDGVALIGDHDVLAEHQAAAGMRVRLRLINTDSDAHRLTLTGTAFRVAAVDGHDLNEPTDVEKRALRLPAGGRYDLTFTMPDTPVALVVGNDHDGGLRLLPDGAPATAAPDTTGWPELDLLTYGAPAAVPFDATSTFDRHFTMVLDRGLAMVDDRPAYAQTVNGRGHPTIPEQLVTEGDLVRFTVVNRSLETHPWHLHGHHVLVLARDGRPSSGSPLWVDTFNVRPGEVWEVAFEAANPGLWMNHCHNLPHVEAGMMMQLSYDGVTTPFHGAHSPRGADSAGQGSHEH